jgi:hypothetical protein
MCCQMLYVTPCDSPHTGRTYHARYSGRIGFRRDDLARLYESFDSQRRLIALLDAIRRVNAVNFRNGNATYLND